MMTGSVTATGPDVSISSRRRRCERGCRSLGRTRPKWRSRRGSRGRWHIRGQLGDGVGSLHRQRFLTCHRLSGQVSQSEIYRRRLGPHAVAVHDHLNVGVLYLDVRSYHTHTPDAYA